MSTQYKSTITIDSVLGYFQKLPSYLAEGLLTMLLWTKFYFQAFGDPRETKTKFQDFQEPYEPLMTDHCPIHWEVSLFMRYYQHYLISNVSKLHFLSYNIQQVLPQSSLSKICMMLNLMFPNVFESLYTNLFRYLAFSQMGEGYMYRFPQLEQALCSGGGDSPQHQLAIAYSYRQVCGFF